MDDRKRDDAEEQLDVGLRDSFPASDPPSVTIPAAEGVIPPGVGVAPQAREDKHFTVRRRRRVVIPKRA